MTVETAQNQIDKIAAELVCEACGGNFSCGANIGVCWCFDIEVSLENLTGWREKYQNCLCENCLSDAANLVVESENNFER